MSVQQLTLESKPVEDIKPYRWITLEEQKRFCNFLKTLGINFDKLGWCASEWGKYRCSIDHSHTKKIQYMACGSRGICPRCSMSYASKRAEIMYQWIYYCRLCVLHLRTHRDRIEEALDIIHHALAAGRSEARV